jgi:hypothetical protein
MNIKTNKLYIFLATATMILSTLACSVLQVGVVTPTSEGGIQPISEGSDPSPTSDTEGTEEESQGEQGQEEEPVILSAVAWQGHIASMPEGSQYDDVLILNPEGTGEYGLAGATPEIEAEIRTLRDGEGPQMYVHLWGAFVCGVDDVNGCQLLVDRLQYGTQMAEEEIFNWVGTIKGYNFNMGPVYGFVLDGEVPIVYGIYASQDPSLQDEIESLRDTDTLVQVSGKLLVGFPDVNSTRIEVSSLEVIEEGSAIQPTQQMTIDPTADYQVYVNNRYGYQFKYPADRATLNFYGPTDIPAGDLPEGMTSQEYLDTLLKEYTDQLCIQIEYSLGYIWISAEPNNTDEFMVDCGNSELFAGEKQPLERNLSIGSEVYLARGFEYIGTGETLDQHNEMVWIDLEDGTRIVYGATSRTDANYLDYTMKTQIILERIIGTYQPLE